MRLFKITTQITIAFSLLAAFFTLLFNIAVTQSAYSQTQNLRVRAHPNFSNKFSGKAYVIDGDSIKVGGNEVRLYEVDAPEYKQQCLDSAGNEYPCGKMSMSFLIKLIGGKFVECEYSQKDKYDRYLSKCYIEGKSINEEILKNGMAVIYDISEASKNAIKLEELARKNKLGIWQGGFQLPKEYRKSHPRKGH